MYKLKNSYLLFLVVAGLTFLINNCNSPSQNQSEILVKANKWQSLRTVEEDGLLGERVDLWRNNRLWYIAESGYLIDGFENK